MKLIFCCVVASLLLISCSDNDGGNNLIAQGGVANDDVNENLSSDVPVDIPSDTPIDVPSDTPTDTPTDTPIDIPTDTPTDTPINIPIDTSIDVPTDIPSEEYIDSTISLRYPSSWLVNPNGPTAGVNAQFFAPQINSIGGNDNCGFVYLFDPSVTLLDIYDEALVLFDSAPEPQEEFLEVNGVPAGRISGIISMSGFQIPAVVQIMSLNGQQVFGLCVGTSDEAFDLILASVNFI